ncbi:hypothetical protein AR540_21800 [Pseudomonas sp. EpS/L25]|nr:hypothetical protein AR540_21800 [Pseudomonas sp. EpS/L25]
MAPIDALDTRQTLRGERKPAPLAKAFEMTTQPPVQRRAGDVAQGRAKQQRRRCMALGQQQPGQGRFRLQR